MNVIIVNRPELTPEEHTKRMEKIKKAAIDLVLATERAKQKKATKIIKGGQTA